MLSYLFAANVQPGVNQYTITHKNVGNAEYFKRFVSLVRHNTSATENITVSISHDIGSTFTKVTLRNYGSTPRDVTINLLIVLI